MLLALRRALSDSSAVQVFVFDEVDAGIGGRTAEVVGRKMAEIAEGGQVLCITHLPQIAAFARQHYRVEKRTEGSRTRSHLSRLSDAERVKELVRMVAGTEDSATAATFAQELLASAAALADGSAREEFVGQSPTTTKRDGSAA